MQVKIDINELNVPLTGSTKRSDYRAPKILFGIFGALAFIGVIGLLTLSTSVTKSEEENKVNFISRVSSEVTVHIIRHGEKPDDGSPDLE